MLLFINGYIKRVKLCLSWTIKKYFGRIQTMKLVSINKLVVYDLFIY